MFSWILQQELSGLRYRGDPRSRRLCSHGAVFALVKRARGMRLDEARARSGRKPYHPAAQCQELRGPQGSWCGHISHCFEWGYCSAQKILPAPFQRHGNHGLSRHQVRHHWRRFLSIIAARDALSPEESLESVETIGKDKQAQDFTAS